MIGINKGPITLGLLTVFQRMTVGVQPSPLGKGAMVGVIVQNTLNNVDVGTTANNIEIMVGDASAQVYQMLPGQESPVIYADDLEDVYVRVRTGAVAVDVTLIVYKQAEK